MTDQLKPQQILDMIEDTESEKARELLEEAADVQREHLLDVKLAGDAMHPVWKKEDEELRNGVDTERLLAYLHRLSISTINSLVGWTWIAKQVGVGRLKMVESTVGDRVIENRVLLRDTDGLLDPGPMVYNDMKELLEWLVNESGHPDEDGTFLPEHIEAAAQTKQHAFRCTACDFVLPGEPASIGTRSHADGLPSHVLCERCVSEEQEVAG